MNFLSVKVLSASTANSALLQNLFQPSSSCIVTFCDFNVFVFEVVCCALGGNVILTDLDQS